MTYLLIFAFKIIDNSLATLRLIVVANGKKMIGALLNFVISVIWVISTALVVTNINEDYFKVFVFALGSFIGSYFGSFLEEKLAMGSNLLFVISKTELHSILADYEYEKINSYIYIVYVLRKNKFSLIKKIKSFNKNANIISESASKIDF